MGTETEEFPTVRAGQWVQPVRSGYRMQCCDCGLIHRLDFRLLKYGNGKHKIQFRAFREDEIAMPFEVNEFDYLKVSYVGNSAFHWRVSDRKDQRCNGPNMMLSDAEAVDLYRKLGVALAERGLIEGAK